jgi:hypothetical protein
MCLSGARRPSAALGPMTDPTIGAVWEDVHEGQERQVRL